MKNNAITELTKLAVRLGILRIAPKSGEFPGRRGGPGKPYLVDSRGAGSSVRLRNVILTALAHRLLPFERIDIIAGLAKSGMTWAAWLAQSAGLPYATILIDGPRSAGLQREVEGDISGHRVVLVDNWISSGQSIRDAAAVAIRNGGEVVGAIAVCGRGGHDLPFPVLTAFSIPDLLNAAAEGQLITAEQAKIFIQNEK